MKFTAKRKECERKLCDCRTSHVFGELEEQHFLYHIMSTGAKDLNKVRFSMILHFRSVFSLLLGPNEDRFKAPEGLYHRRL